MPIKLGTTSIGAIYKGTTKISRVYKGDTIVYQEGGQLPPEYIELEYIESTGTQYIDTGVVTNSNVQISATMQITQVATDKSMCLFGSWNDFQQFRVYRRLSDGLSRCQKGNTTTDLTSVDFTQKHNIDFNKNDNLYLDNNLITSVGNDIFTGTLSICLFISYSRNTSRLEWENNGAMKLYSCQIYDNSILVRDFVPAYRRVDGVVGLYDLVNGVFYTNAGTSEFKRGAMILNDYQEVEYIESTGTQYIDTGLLSTNDNYEFIAKIKHTVIINGVNFGATNGFNVSVQNNVYRTTGQLITDIAPSTTSFDKIKLKSLSTSNKLELSINGVIHEATYTNWVYDSIIAVFGIGTSPVRVANLSVIQLSKLKIKKNDTLVRDFVPVYRKADTEIGLLDTKNMIFYTNAGTGTFLKGNDL